MKETQTKVFSEGQVSSNSQCTKYHSCNLW